MQIVRTIESAVSADGSSVSITFEIENKPLVLNFNGASIDSIMSELTAVAGAARTRGYVGTLIDGAGI